MAKKKQKPHRALKRDITVEQIIVLNHLIKWTEVPLQHIHPQQGMQGEIQAIAFATCRENNSDVIIRLDRIPHIAGVPYTVVLRDAFPEFPACIDLVIKGWTPQSMLLVAAK